MAKVIFEIQGNLFDFWELRSLTREERYNPENGTLEYLLVINRTAIQTNYAHIELSYPTEALREMDYKNIKEQLDIFEGVLFIPAGMPVDALKAAIAQIHSNTDTDAENDDFDPNGDQIEE